MDVACLEAPCQGERKEPCWCDSEDGGPSHERRKVTGSQEDQGLWENHPCHKDVGNSHEIISLVCLPLGFTFQGGHIGHSMMFDGFPGGSSGKEPTCQCRNCRRREFDPWLGKIPWRRA